ncbi:Ground-like domain-containing protein [Aphelenchoides besseyi]|nr:Ground-like domain-containing protein [Aphelenchoides besseyi]
MKKLSTFWRFSCFFLLIECTKTSATFFGGGCQCAQSAPRCPAPQPCGFRQQQFAPPITIQGQCPPCDCSGLGPISGGSGQSFVSSGIIPQTVVGGGSYAISPGGNGPVIGVPPFQNPGYVSANNPQFGGGPQLIIPQQTGYVKDRGSTPHPHGRHTGRNSLGGDDDVYDEVIPTPGSQAADISVDSKKLVPYNDVYIKRNRFLRQLRNRALRQFSAKSLTDSMPQMEEDSYQPSVCNNERLGHIMSNAMVEDLSVSKKLVRKAAELAFDGRKFDVLCASGEFSYSVYAKVFCEATRDNVTCFAFMV